MRSNTRANGAVNPIQRQSADGAVNPPKRLTADKEVNSPQRLTADKEVNSPQKRLADGAGRFLHKRSKDIGVIIVGAGAAGMTAAVSAARMGARVVLLEHMDQAGKKILSTGNGKCNFTNRAQGVEFYRGQNPAFVLPALSQFGFSETMQFFEELGICPKEKRGGYFYPASEQASAVRDVLLMELGRLGVEVYCQVGIRSIRKKNGRFVFDTKQGIYESRACVIATGGKAAKKTGSDGSGIPYVRGFGHKVSEFIPALVQLQGKQSFLKELAGIRADASITIYADDTELSKDTGEVMLTDFGVSGIPAFQVSRFGTLALQNGRKVYVRLDFAPQMTEEALLQRMEQRFFRIHPQNRVKEAFVGFLHTKLIPVLLKQAKVFPDKKCGDCSGKELKAIASVIKGLHIDIIGSKSFDFAQVCAGGVDTEEICPETMESKLVGHLYFAGEVMDIDGMCGGYNLQWAWSSGWVAGHYGGMI